MYLTRGQWNNVVNCTSANTHTLAHTPTRTYTLGTYLLTLWSRWQNGRWRAGSRTVRKIPHLKHTRYWKGIKATMKEDREILSRHYFIHLFKHGLFLEPSYSASMASVQTHVGKSLRMSALVRSGKDHHRRQCCLWEAIEKLQSLFFSNFTHGLR